MSKPDINISRPTDQRVECPHKDCKVGFSLTPQGVEMLLAQNTKCREHDMPLEVVSE